MNQDTYLNIVGALPLVKLNEGRLLGSKATVDVEAGELKLKPPVDADVDDCNNTIWKQWNSSSIYLQKKQKMDFMVINFEYIY